MLETSMSTGSATNDAKKFENSIPKVLNLMEEVLERTNMIEALRRVERNAGCAGVDGLSTSELRDFLRQNWATIKSKLLDGTYTPRIVRGVEIPKPNGKTRRLGIPTVLDRLIQQALAQRLSKIFDPKFSNSSFGFREGRGAKDAILKARKHVNEEGKKYVVDIDLAQFFDEINHDKLMGKLAKKIGDRRVLLLIKKYLRAGILMNATVESRDKGTPQGGPLSPLLSNIVLDELDQELEKRGHSFCRYADDCNIYVRSKRAAERALESISNFIEKKLKLKVNKNKSSADLVTRRKFLGYSFYTSKGQLKIRVASESIKSFKVKIKEKFRRSAGRNLGKLIVNDLNPIIRGWTNYFLQCEGSKFAEELDGWIRRKLRCNLWRQQKRGWTRRTKLISRGLSAEQAIMGAFNQRGPWCNAGRSHMNRAYPKSYFDQIGLESILDRLRMFRNCY
jgi:RNA-directed DNA polymerase